ncbi:MAG: prolyl oligopeptidase family serine peptidase, partial [Flavihumibacter sp.]
VQVAAKGNGNVAIGTSTRGYRIQQQWSQNGMHNLYVIDVKNGTRKLVATGLKRNYERLSPNGKYIAWYDTEGKNWKVYDIASSKTAVLSKGITVPLYDEEDDHPDDAPAHGFMGWLEGDEAAFIYDRYDIWQVDPSGGRPAVCITKGEGRRNRIAIRYNHLDPETDYIKKGDWLLMDLFDYKQKGANWMSYREGSGFSLDTGSLMGATYLAPVKARRAGDFIYVKQTPSSSDVYAGRVEAAADKAGNLAYSSLNPQQAGYNWFTVELKHWPTLAGQTNEGLLYKPENFDPTKKYPVILYFYERDADTRYRYIEPMPVRASVNIAYYTSNGYIVFDPDIKYKTGQPGEDAYNAVVGAARWLARQPWIDSTKMGIQGHSWGGYQVAYLVTRTNMFAAAESGAPVSNMTSAYGGIRWGTGISRQFQYEKTQSRLGKTLWEDPQRYLKNSPLFRADKIKTPLLILHNDKDDAVPWYQGIELFTAMKRLNKKVWLVTYNDELHGIIERRNRKDWTIRMAQFFDHYLKGKPAPRWMTEGIPARDKGIDWGLD